MFAQLTLICNRGISPVAASVSDKRLFLWWRVVSLPASANERHFFLISTSPLNLT